MYRVYSVWSVKSAKSVKSVKGVKSVKSVKSVYWVPCVLWTTFNYIFSRFIDFVKKNYLFDQIKDFIGSDSGLKWKSFGRDFQVLKSDSKDLKHFVTLQSQSCHFGLYQQCKLIVTQRKGRTSAIQSSQLSWAGQYKKCVQYDFQFSSKYSAVAAKNKTTFTASCLQSLARNPPRHISLQFEPS